MYRLILPSTRQTVRMDVPELRTAFERGEIDAGEPVTDERTGLRLAVREVLGLRRPVPLRPKDDTDSVSPYPRTCVTSRQATDWSRPPEFERHRRQSAPDWFMWAVAAFSMLQLGSCLVSPLAFIGLTISGAVVWTLVRRWRSDDVAYLFWTTFGVLFGLPVLAALLLWLFA